MTLYVSPRASASLTSIWEWNARHYSASHADKYLGFLLKELNRVADDPLIGRTLSEDLRSHTMYRSRAGPAHLAIYKIVGNEVEIVDVFHTAQDWRSKLEDI